MTATAVNQAELAGVQQLTFAKALTLAMSDSMAADASVIVFGEDVGTLGGVFRVTDGLKARFGEERCFDTPLAESGIVGMATGMAINGIRPVVELQFDAFAFPAFEQIVSHVAKMGNRTRGNIRLPLVIRIPYAGGIGGVEHHCDSSEGYYVHTPGLTVLTPSTVEDAYVLLRDAIASPDPVVFMEPKKLYFSKATLDLDALRARYTPARPWPPRSQPQKLPPPRVGRCRWSTSDPSSRSTTKPSVPRSGPPGGWWLLQKRRALLPWPPRLPHASRNAASIHWPRRCCG